MVLQQGIKNPFDLRFLTKGKAKKQYHYFLPEAPLE
jgi:hypothetical protein